MCMFLTPDTQFGNVLGVFVHELARSFHAGLEDAVDGFVLSKHFPEEDENQHPLLHCVFVSELIRSQQQFQ